MQKRSILLIALLGALSSLTTIAERHLVLFEKFTNVGCVPCAVFAPPADSLLDARLGDVVEITYHGNYPYPNDEYYLPVKDQVGERINAYGVRAYPTVMLDGKTVNAYIPTIDYMLDKLLEQTPQARINVESALSEDLLSVNVETVLLSATAGKDLRLFVAALEEEVRPERPAFNGQTVFHNEFRQFLTPASGQPVRELNVAGDVMKWSGTWQVERMEDTSELAVVAWLQDMSDGRVIETAYVPRPAKKNLDARILRMADTPSQVCEPRFSGKLWLRNMGSEALTDCEIAVHIGGEAHTFPWKGSLPYLATEEVIIPPFTDFDIDAESEEAIFSVSATALNGSGESSESLQGFIPNVTTGRHEIRLLVSTDNKPEETSWKLLDSTGKTLCESEPYTRRRHDYLTVLPLQENGCYSIEFHDTGADGITGSFGKGFYRLYEADGENVKELLQGDFRTADHTLLFRAAEVVPSSAPALIEDASTMCYNGEMLSIPFQGHLIIADSYGRIFYESEAQAGECVSTSALAPGVYIATLRGIEKSVSLKFIIE